MNGFNNRLNIVADENIPALETWFAGLGTITRVAGRTLSRAQLIHADVLLVRSVTQVNAELLENTPVRFVGSCTIGTDHLDTRWLEQQGIGWSAAPGCNANSVVEYVFCALAALNLNWDKRSFGIVGCGNVGGLLQQRLHQLGNHCAVYDPWLPDNADASSLQEVLQQDVICLHAPLVTDGPHPSKYLLGAAELQQIKSDAILISAGRGAVIDNRALLELLAKGDAFTTVLDVWENEPDINTDLLTKVDIGTPHIAGYSLDGKLAGTRMIREALGRALNLSAPDGEPDNALGTVVTPSEIEQAESIEFSGGAASFAAVRQALLSIYDPRADDQRLRKAAGDELPMAQAFDQLRRTYPERLEFSHYRLTNSQHESQVGAPADRELIRQLAILGLK